MTDELLPILVGALTATPLILSYWVGRFIVRKRVGRALREPRILSQDLFARWTAAGWLVKDGSGSLATEFSPAAALMEWLRVDPDVAEFWVTRVRVAKTTHTYELIADLWKNLPPARAEQSAALLRDEVARASTWWGGAELGWNGRAYAVSGSAAKKRAKNPIPLTPMEDLTAAPKPLPVDAGRIVEEAPGADLLLLLTALRRAECEFVHPLAPKGGAAESLIAGLSTQVGTDVGRKIGAGLGAALGPIGSMVGQYLGGIAGSMGGKALVQQAMPERLAARLKETEDALSRLGELTATPQFLEATRAPERAILTLGQAVEARRLKRSRRFRERIWPTPALAACEEVMWTALGELRAFRSARDQFVQIAQKSPGPVAGGMLLQNPWLVGSLPEGPERLNGARAALNQAARALKSSDSGG